MLYQALDRAERDVTFLFELFMHANIRVRQEQQSFSLASLLLQEKLHDLVQRLMLHDEMSNAWRQVSEGMPYPLDGATAGAVQAAIQHYVWPWEVFEVAGLVQGWVEDAYVAEGKVQLPFWSVYTNSERPSSLRVAVPTHEELQAIFQDEVRYQQWLAGDDFRYGFADVPDAGFEARCDEVDAAVRQFVEHQGVVQQGWAVRLESVPMEFLKTAPVLEGEWIDAHVVELAEWGALLQKKRYAFRCPDDNSPFAWERIGKATETGFQEADDETLWKNRDAARSRIAAFSGNTQEIGGRRYLRFVDYARWKGRAVPGKLEKQPGILAASWHAWRELQGPRAQLAGVPVGRIRCWADAYPHSVHEAGEAQKRSKERADLLSRLRHWTLHDLDREPGLFTRPSPLGKRSFLDEARVWREHALFFGQDVTALQRAVTTVGQRYFEGTPLLLGEEERALDDQGAFWQRLVGLFNDLVVAELESSGDAGERVLNLGLTAIEEAGKALSTDRAAYLVDLAKADALRTLGENNAAAEVMERHLG